jgi:hypothetical protein
VFLQEHGQDIRKNEDHAQDIELAQDPSGRVILPSQLRAKIVADAGPSVESQSSTQLRRLAPSRFP